MPYGWYSRYTHSAYTLADPEGDLENQRKWLVEYFTNENLQGAPFQRSKVDAVAFNWGSGSPLKYHIDLPWPLPDIDIDLMPTDHFSVRFSKIQRFRNGWYRFTLRGDDGIRLWIDDKLVINAWRNQSATEYTAECYLTGGDHIMRIEYYERTGQASVNFDVEPINFHYEVFEDILLSGTPGATFDDTATEIEWRHAPPVSSLNQGQFSLRGKANFNFHAGKYRFHAIHTGGCRIYLDNNLVFDDWDGTGAINPEVAISTGSHEVRVEFKQEDTIPAPGVKGYYRAALNFGWTDQQWQADFYHDSAREALKDAVDLKPDHNYMLWRTLSLTGSPIYHTHYAASHIVPNEYKTSDGSKLEFVVTKPQQFSDGIAGAPDLTGNFLSAHLRRKFYIEKSGWYNVAMVGGEGSRVIIDNKEVLEDHVASSPKTNSDIYLKAGVHDAAIEWAVSFWGKSINFSIQPVKWQVRYYDGTEFDTIVAIKNLDSVNKIISEKPTSLVGTTTYSARATRKLSLPLGRYRFQLRTDDGARLKINGITEIDAWGSQSPSSYFAEVEHHGGDLNVEIEYFQKYGDALLEFEFRSVGYYGEYYHGNTLQNPVPGSGLDRNVPVAYRFEPDVNFDWGSGNRLDRVGSDNFSARWRGRMGLPVGRWRLDLTSDDGVRLFVDGRLVIDQWHNQPPTKYSHIVDLTGRDHDIKVEYYESSGKAQCQLKFLRQF